MGEEEASLLLYTSKYNQKQLWTVGMLQWSESNSFATKNNTFLAILLLWNFVIFSLKKMKSVVGVVMLSVCLVCCQHCYFSVFPALSPLPFSLSVSLMFVFNPFRVQVIRKFSMMY